MYLNIFSILKTELQPAFCAGFPAYIIDFIEKLPCQFQTFGTPSKIGRIFQPNLSPLNRGSLSPLRNGAR
jgi:hypothetical protein